MTDVPEVCIRYWAAARAAAGVAEDTVHAATLAEALAAVRVRVERPRLEAVIAVSSFIVDGTPAGARDAAEVLLGQGSQVDVLPPYAGG